MSSVIQVDQVVKRYGDFTAVDGVSFSVERGECYGLLGPNGAGKTTLFKLIVSMARRSGGSLSVFGLDPERDGVAIKARLGVVGQEDSLDPDLDVWGNLQTYGRYFGLAGPEFTARCRELLDFLELTEKLHMPIMALSGGMKRRLAIVRALVNEPELLLLDEPTTGLDPQVRHAIWKAIRGLKERGLTILLTTHYMEEAAQLADRVGIVDHGQRIAEGSPQELIQANLPAYVLELPVNLQEEGWREGLEQALAQDPGEGPAPRLEVHGDRGYAFQGSEGRLRELLLERALHGAQLRATSLEDVFLLLTGRSLRD